MVAVLTSTLLLAGCGLFGSDDGRPPSTTSTTSSTTTTTEAPVARSAAPEVLDPGDEPRQELRVAYQEGDEAQVTFTSDLQVTQESAGRTQRLDSPPIAQTLTYRVGEVGPEGAALTVSIDEVAARGKGTGLDEDAIDALDEELAPMVGVEGRGTVTPLGELVDFTFDVPDDAPDEVAAQLAALEDQVPALGPSLPAEPVGVGATWRTTSTSSVGGAEVGTTTTVTVTDLQGGTLAYTATIETSAEPQDIVLTGLPKGTTARLESSDLRGSSTGALGLDHVGLSLRTRIEGPQQLTLTSDGVAAPLRQHLQIAYVAAPVRD
jgi:hypothetical protein